MPSPVADYPSTREGLVVASHGRHCVVETLDGERRICHPRGKRSQSVVGDRVVWQPAPQGQGNEGPIEQVQERRNLFYRQDEIRTKSFAANLDQILILIAAEPVFSEMQLARALIAAESAGIPALIALNKSDLPVPFERAWLRLQAYRYIAGNGTGHVIGLSLNQSKEAARAALLPLLRGKTTLVLGPSGAGKSTLVNLLVPGATVLTAEISQALNSGRHTTTSPALYWIDSEHDSAVLDSPGFQEFGLHHVAPKELAHCMPDIAAHAKACKFYNCTHLHEPGCGVISALKTATGADAISPIRYSIYSELFSELGQTRY